MLLFLHGAGERGNDLTLVATHGPPKLVAAGRELPFVLVSPQCPADQTWSNEALVTLLDDVLERYAVDVARVYLTGLSMGGYATWSLGLTHPERFAAVAPICGGGDLLPLLLPEPANAEALKTLPVWAFHGAHDTVVRPGESERLVEALKQIGACEVKFTLYPDADHDSWTATYENPTLYEWFLAHDRRRPRVRRRLRAAS